MSGILKKAHTFIGEVKENDSGPKNTAISDDLCIQYMPDADKQEDQHLTADPFKANLTGKFVVIDRAHHPGNVIDHHK